MNSFLDTYYDLEERRERSEDEVKRCTLKVINFSVWLE